MEPDRERPPEDSDDLPEFEESRLNASDPGGNSDASSDETSQVSDPENPSYTSEEQPVDDFDGKGANELDESTTAPSGVSDADETSLAIEAISPDRIDPQPSASESRQSWDLVGRWGKSAPSELWRGPYRPGTDDNEPPRKLSESDGSANRPSTDTSSSGVSPRLTPAADGGPAMARPVVLVSLATEQVNAIVDRALTSARRRDAKTVEQIADSRVKLAFWEFRCEQRALSRSYR